MVSILKPTPRRVRKPPATARSISARAVSRVCKIRVAVGQSPGPPMAGTLLMAPGPIRKYARRANGIRAAALASSAFDGQGDLRSSEQGRRAGRASARPPRGRPRRSTAGAGRRGAAIFSTTPKSSPSRSRMGHLFNVQFNESRVVPWFQPHPGQVACVPGRRTPLRQGFALRVRESISRPPRSSAPPRRRLPRQPRAEARWLLGGEDDQLDRAAGLKTRAPQVADGRQTSEHADDPVIASGVGDGVDVRAGCHRRQGGIGAFPAGKHVPRRRRCGPSDRRPRHQPATRQRAARSALGKQDAGDDRSRGLGDGGQGVDLPVQGRSVHGKSSRQMSSHSDKHLP